MGRPYSQSLEVEAWHFTWPFLLVYAGLGASLSAMLLALIPTGNLSDLLAGTVTFFRVLLLVVGILLAAGGVWWRLTGGHADDFEERSKSGILLALAGGTVLGGYVAMSEEWDSLRLFLIVLWGISLGAVPLILMPRIARRVAVSVLVLFHFGGILTAVTAVQGPGGNPPPWLPTIVWNRVYRHYLTFAYMNNAYHFYSPEP